MQRREFLAIFGGLLGVPSAAHAISTSKVLHLGILSIGSRTAPYVVTFVERLNELGYYENQNLSIKFAQIDRIDGFGQAARELVRSAVDIIVASGPEAALKAAQGATRNIPIVMLAVDFDPLLLDHVGSLAHPTGNVTGIFFQQTELVAKRLEFLKGLLPSPHSLTVFWDQFSAPQLNAAQNAASALDLDIVGVELGNRPYDYDRALTRVPPRYRGALLIPASPIFYYDRKRLCEFILRNQIISTFPFREFVEAGGLFSYGPNLVNFTRRAAEYVEKIANGTKARDLPIEQPTRFELVVNLATAATLKLANSEALLLAADQAIE